jgi:rhodanese-related sulfurtransferase
MNIEKLIRENAIIVDVRTKEEFLGGHVAGSINIPLQEVQQRVEDFKRLQGPLVLCCASGNRSGMAANYLNHQGVDCVNGGSWMDINYYQSLSV